MTGKRITVLLVEDHIIVREGLRALMKHEEDIEVVGEAGHGREAVELARKLCPDVIVMDIAMPLMNGLEATRQILRERRDARVLILSAHSEDAYVDHVMRLGAAGYLTKQTAAHILPRAIRKVNKGIPCFSPGISRRLIKRRPRSGNSETVSAPGENPGLSSREMEVLQLIAEGKANKETAGELKISIKTVEKHRQSLMEKLDIHDTAGLTRYAIFSGVIEGGVRKPGQ